MNVSACERDIESLVFERWIEKARLCAPIRFVLLMHVCNSCCSNCTSCCLLCKPERCLINLETLPSELGAIERLKISHRLIMGKWCLQASTFIFHWIFVKLADNQDWHKISDDRIPAGSD